MELQFILEAAVLPIGPQATEKFFKKPHFYFSENV